MKRNTPMLWGMALAMLLTVVALAGCAPTTEVEPEPAETTEAEGAADEVPTAQMKNGLGEEVTLALLTLPDSRGYIYCELVFMYGDIGSDIYSTSPLAQCDLEWWENLDLEAVAAERGAVSVIKNGPQWWSMDEVGVMESEPVMVAGVEMNFGAHLPPGTMSTPLYTVYYPAKYQDLVWKAGEPTYRLVDSDGYVYVLQGHKIPADELAALGERFQQLPDGWEYVIDAPGEDLVMNLTPAEPIPSVKDEFDQYWIRIPSS